MVPIVHLVRHGQGLHNVPPYDDSLIDPELTSHGRTQCDQLRSDFPYHNEVTHLTASPMRRALQTCIAGFGKSNSNKPLLAMDVLQETSDAPNDTGSDVDTLRAEFGDSVDFTGVSPEWTDKRKGGPFACEVDEVAKRAAAARVALYRLAQNGDGHIVAVSHGGFLHFLSDDWEGVSMQRSESAVQTSMLVANDNRINLVEL